MDKRCQMKMTPNYEYRTEIQKTENAKLKEWFYIGNANLLVTSPLSPYAEVVHLLANKLN